MPEWEKPSAPNFRKNLLKLSLSFSQKLDSVTVVVLARLILQLQFKMLKDFISLSISELKIVKTANFEETLLRSKLSITQYLDALTALDHNILTFSLNLM